MAGTTFDSDAELVARAGRGDREAVAVLLERHLHPAWRIAVAMSSSTRAAEEAVAAGFCDALTAAGRHPDATVSLRTRIAAAVHAAAVANERPGALRAVHDDPVLAAFTALPVASRAALWFTEVEGGEPEQVAPVLGVERGVASAMATRAATALRDRIAGDAAARTSNPRCPKVLAKVPAHAADRLPPEVRSDTVASGWRPAAVSASQNPIATASSAAALELDIATAMRQAGWRWRSSSAATASRSPRPARATSSASLSNVVPAICFPPSCVGCCGSR
jgi:DNA-directed RNA polymerase specialized sigma24 family protein